MVVEYLTALPATQLVAEMYKRGVDYHLVKGQVKVHGQPCEPEGLGHCDVGRLTQNMLAGRHTAYAGVDFWAAVSARDGKRCAPGLPERLEHLVHQGPDAVAYPVAPDNVAEIVSVSVLGALELPIAKVPTDCSHRLR